MAEQFVSRTYRMCLFNKMPSYKVPTFIYVYYFEYYITGTSKLNHPELRKAFADVRKVINQTVRSCADNIKVTVYMDEVLDEPIVETVGNGENKLLITIDSDNGNDFTWTEETLAKAFWDGWDKGEEIAKNVVACIATSLASVLRSFQFLTISAARALKWY